MTAECMYCGRGGQTANRSYIGQGRVLHRIPRFVDDEKRGRGPVRGFVLVPRRWRETSCVRYSKMLMAVERSLLDVATKLRKFPRHNSDNGALAGFRWLLERASSSLNSVEVAFFGPDPLVCPEQQGTELDGYRFSSHIFGGDFELDDLVYHWNVSGFGSDFDKKLCPA